jgi:hypothetical protein
MHEPEFGRVGLLWIGEAHYKSIQDFTAEAASMGLSRRISAVPRDFKLGETWVWLAHPKAIVMSPAEGEKDPEYAPGVFHVFKPSRIEYVVKGTETEEDMDALEKRGLTLVQVERIGKQEEL